MRVRGALDRLEATASVLPVLSGVYYIINTADGGAMYVGSACNIFARFKNHRAALRSGRHHCRKLQEAWTRDGEDAFAFRIALPTDSVDDARKMEQVLLNNSDALYNTCKIVGINGVAHLPKTAEHRKRIGDAHRGRPKSPESIARMRAALTGRKAPPRSEEWRRKVSAANTGREPWIKGKHQSVEHYTRIQLARKKFFARTLGRPWIDLEV